MDILSKLFGSSKKRDKSYIRTWAVERENELPNSDDLPIYTLFAALMYSLSCFGKENPNTKIPPQLMAANEQFSGDKTLFEIGCYMYFRLDIWLFQNAPNRREEISTFFMH
ncbi:hypothetical protein KKF86_07315 [bacterium]|nr:hypothetical protein [bacterium]